ncbi:hypothetical protein SF83666_a40590 (plasmid) [Sinorhizobium fredii CCBAU 83666]|nr:hypothetical protein SF83666_a40590 [Sinorhizobium fredii CCBAU 83666]
MQYIRPPSPIAPANASFAEGVMAERFAIGMQPAGQAGIVRGVVARNPSE